MHVETRNLGFGSLVYKRAHFISATYSLVYHCHLMTATQYWSEFLQKKFLCHHWLLLLFFQLCKWVCWYNSDWSSLCLVPFSPKNKYPYKWNRRNWEMRAKRIRISYIGVNDLWTYTYLVWYRVNLIFCMDIQMQYHYL